ncbi:hypothetical protein OKW21_001553 [Catalinimonas alkaloidigena]|uniref:hypothetical protein n=1 Tax=Catalinimonas alkaloidigena TaxID=1075417 RepID=UPI002406E039|nr:hypothetical protein [Catalinimonas alkaloidigena]MDF9796290.1 hypothetical protein [Catalinimonas alkaloidigena]
MKRPAIILFAIALFFAFTANAQNKFEFNGQAQSWMNYSSGNDLEIGMGLRYIPEFNYSIPLENEGLIDFKASPNMVASLNFHPFDTANTDADLSPYRAWARYSTNQLELRLGLQKISFGSASVLRPLMWFDQIDPRDPLQLTNGVWGALGRYYFLNNANIWLWVLYGNENVKGWERVETYEQHPEFGGRIQYPVSKGEVALSYHHRTADSRSLGVENLAYAQIPEDRIGLDGKWDIVVGFWFEGSWTHKSKDVGIYTNQTLLNVGTDYTFGIGNGLNVVAEQLMISLDKDAFAFDNTSMLSGISASYPSGLFDNISAVFYYDWTGSNLYSTINWQRDYNKFSVYLMAFSNPVSGASIQQNELVNPLAGRGIQIMLVYNH